MYPLGSRQKFAGRSRGVCTPVGLAQVDTISSRAGKQVTDQPSLEDEVAGSPGLSKHGAQASVNEWMNSRSGRRWLRLKQEQRKLPTLRHSGQDSRVGINRKQEILQTCPEGRRFTHSVCTCILDISAQACNTSNFPTGMRTKIAELQASRWIPGHRQRVSVCLLVCRHARGWVLEITLVSLSYTS